MLAWITAAALAAGPQPPGLRIEGERPTAVRAALDLDPAETTFSGVVEVDLEVDRTAVLWLNAADLEVTAASARVAGREEPVAVIDGGPEHVGFQLDRPVAGPVTLVVAYTGAADTVGSQGLFRQEEGGDAFFFTQFEAMDARRAIPCIDDPQHKIPWTLTLRVPGGMGAFANTPVASEQVASGVRTVQFAPTKPLPSYLVAFAVGPFEVVDAGVGGRNATPIRLLVPPGRGADTEWARETAGPILAATEDWFDSPYPFEKLDLVAIPLAVGFGAMEHPGLITFEQQVMVARPEDDTVWRRRTWAEYLAHELAHQWFGNLVTPTWWEDLWLNESFATMLEGRVTRQRWPEWGQDESAAAVRAGALQQDVLASARQIREPIRTADDVESAFDGITYGKGQAVLDQVAAWLGEDTFRAALKGYLTRHAWGSASADDFFAAFGDAAGDEVEPMFRSFVDQPGVPRVAVSLDCTGDVPSLAFEQRRFLSVGRPGGAIWQVPIAVRYDAGGQAAHAELLLTRRRGTLPLTEASACPAWVVPNDGWSGYYLADPGQEAVRTLLSSDAAGLTERERLGLLGDAGMLVEAGTIEPTVLLEAIPDLLARDQRRLTAGTLGTVAALDENLVPDDLRPRYAEFVRATYGGLASELGWTPTADEGDDDALLRPSVLSLVTLQGEDPEHERQATALAGRWLEAGEGADPTVLSLALQVAARHGDAALYEQLEARALAEEDRGRRARLLSALGAFQQPDLMLRALNLSLREDLDLNDRAALVFGPLSRAATRPAAFAWVKENIDAVEAGIPAIARSYLVYTASGFCTEAEADDAEAFFTDRARRWIGGRRALAQTLEGIRRCAASTERQAPAVRAFLEGWRPAGPAADEG